MKDISESPQDNWIDPERRREKKVGKEMEHGDRCGNK
jgi:hypothetical protein